MAKPRFDIKAQVETLGADSLLPPERLTQAQADGLRRIRDNGPGAWCHGRGRAGGSISRMFDKMAERGLCTTPPHKITHLGSDMLDTFDVGNRARQIDLHPPG